MTCFRNNERHLFRPLFLAPPASSLRENTRKFRAFKRSDVFKAISLQLNYTAIPYFFLILKTIINNHLRLNVSKGFSSLPIFYREGGGVRSKLPLPGRTCPVFIGRVGVRLSVKAQIIANLEGFW